MFILPKSRKWTFIVFRDNRRPALQFHLERTILLLIPLLVTCLVLASVWLMQAYHKKKQEHQQALTQIESHEEVIETLQHDLVSLSIQTEEMQEKMRTLEALEEEIHELTGSSISEDTLSQTKEPTEHHRSLTLASLSERAGQGPKRHRDTSLKGHLGGENFDSSPEELSALSHRTKDHLHTLQSQLPSITERLKDARAHAEAYREKLRATPSIWPTTSKRITSHFGHRRDPFTKKRSFHSGIDIGGKVGDPVYATADGKVAVAGYHRGMGNYITIDHRASGMQTRYLHLNKILVNRGDQVHKGDKIALLGSTGRSTGPHLHYEVMVDNELVDPRPFMDPTPDK